MTHLPFPQACFGPVESVRFVTFGCKANQYDTQVLREALLRRGLEESSKRADLVVVNTCAVTAEAGRKARQLIRRLHREDASTRVAVTGCSAESEPEILRALPGVEWVLQGGEAKRPVNFLKQLGHEVDPEELGIPSGITEFSGHTRAFVKIQDGCDMACSFCIIPSTRGKSRSRAAEELGLEIRGLIEAGHVEVVLCGIHIGHWGRDIGSDLAALMRHLVDLKPLGPEGEALPYRLRLSSIEATEVTDALVEVMATRPDRIAPHLHMPLQSGSNGVLERMNRWYDVDTYLKACDRIRSALDRPAYTADVLVGFPGESEAEFDETLSTVRAAGFARLHVFPFSARPGTAAWGAKDPVAPEAVRERRARLSELADELGDAFRGSLDGARETVVLEGFSGLSGRYQRVPVDPDELIGLPKAVEVDLEVERDEEGRSRLRGRRPTPVA